MALPALPVQPVLSTQPGCGVATTAGHRSPTVAVWVLACAWIGCAAGAAAVLLHTSLTPSPMQSILPERPASIAGIQADGQTTVVVAIHPRCPCSKATVANLDRILTKAGDSPTIIALVYSPAHAEEDWIAEGGLVEQLSQMPNLTVRHDPGGVEAAAIGLSSSGQLVVYSGTGRRLFSGGITPSRGHEGDCDGMRTLARIVDGDTTPGTTTPSYGCPLESPAARTARATAGDSP